MLKKVLFAFGDEYGDTPNVLVNGLNPEEVKEGLVPKDGPKYEFLPNFVIFKIKNK